MPDNVSSHKPLRRYERSTVTIRGLSFVAYGLVFGGMGGLAAFVALFGVVGYPGRYLLYPVMLAFVYGVILAIIKDDRILDRRLGWRVARTEVVVALTAIVIAAALPAQMAAWKAATIITLLFVYSGFYFWWIGRVDLTQPAGSLWPQPPVGAPGDAWAQQTKVGPAPALAFGGFWIRVLAFVIDTILLWIVELILIWALKTTGLAIFYLIWILYFIGLWRTTGQTLGMMPFGLRVVRNSDGGKLTWGNAIGRFIGLIWGIAFFLSGVIRVAFDSRKRGLHDLGGDTVVVRKIG
jgi:uncharacterized RDD family membrane protein YckC